NHDARSAATVEVKILPVRMVGCHLAFDALSDFGISKAGEELFGASVGNPRWQRGRQCRSACNIRILVGANVEAAIACRLNLFDDFRHGSPTRFSAYLHMKDFDWDSRLAANANGLVNRGHLRSTFASHVRAVDTTVPGCYLGQF